VWLPLAVRAAVSMRPATILLFGEPCCLLFGAATGVLVRARPMAMAAAATMVGSAPGQRRKRGASASRTRRSGAGRTGGPARHEPLAINHRQHALGVVRPALFVQVAGFASSAEIFLRLRRLPVTGLALLR